MFDVNPSLATSIAEERLARSLDSRCVPDGLVRAMARMRLDPFGPVVLKLQELECERRRLRPDDPIRSWPAEEDKNLDPFAQAARAEAGRVPSGKCRKAFEALFGLDETEFSLPEK
jgi:hypothetical protein